ncbi:MAG: bifunctional phosphopantothenoylcysteine decarboxylase/phosphopantothenate--cysteine ligase CoaBC, partial [Campylobacterota bacterium]
ELDAATATQNAQAMLTQKELDAVCLNVLDGSESFGSDDNEVTFITQTKQQHFAKADKLAIAKMILQSCKEL